MWGAEDVRLADSDGSALALLRRRQEAVTAKPTVSDLGIDLAAQVWHRSGRGDGAIEVAFARAAIRRRGPRHPRGVGADARGG